MEQSIPPPVNVHTNPSPEISASGYVAPPPPPPPQSIPQAPRSKSIVVFIVAAIVIGLAAVGAYMYMTQKPTKPAPINITISPTPSPTPIRTPSLIATQSAFLLFEQHLASLSANIENYILTDPSLSPPTIDLPLGFKN